MQAGNKYGWRDRGSIGYIIMESPLSSDPGREPAATQAKECHISIARVQFYGCQKPSRKGRT